MKRKRLKKLERKFKALKKALFSFERETVFRLSDLEKQGCRRLTAEEVSDIAGRVQKLLTGE